MCPPHPPNSNLIEVLPSVRQVIESQVNWQNWEKQSRSAILEDRNRQVCGLEMDFFWRFLQWILIFCFRAMERGRGKDPRQFELAESPVEFPQLRKTQEDAENKLKVASSRIFWGIRLHFERGFCLFPADGESGKMKNLWQWNRGQKNCKEKV